MVMQDELENGVRAYLNFGHTFAHALEAHTRYRRFCARRGCFTLDLQPRCGLHPDLGLPLIRTEYWAFRAAFNLAGPVT